MSTQTGDGSKGLFCVDSELTSAVREARLRVQRQIEKEKKILETLNVDGYRDAPLALKSSFLTERIKREQTLNECTDRFVNFLTNKEDAFKVLEQRLRFPLGILQHIRSQSPWDKTETDRGTLISQGFSSFHSKEAKYSTSERVPYFVALLERSKQVYQEIGLLCTLENWVGDPTLPLAHTEVERLVVQVTQTKKEVEELERETETKTVEINSDAEESRSLTSIRETLEADIASNPTAAALLAIDNRELWVRSTELELDDLRSSLKTIQDKIRLKTTQRKRMDAFIAETQTGVNASQRELALLDSGYQGNGVVSSSPQSSVAEEEQPNESWVEQANHLKVALRELSATVKKKSEELSVTRTDLDRVSQEALAAENERTAISEELEHLRMITQKHVSTEREMLAKIEAASDEVQKTKQLWNALSEDLGYLAKLNPQQTGQAPYATDELPLGSCSGFAESKELLERARKARRLLRGE